METHFGIATLPFLFFPKSRQLVCTCRLLRELLSPALVSCCLFVPLLALLELAMLRMRRLIHWRSERTHGDSSMVDMQTAQSGGQAWRFTPAACGPTKASVFLITTVWAGFRVLRSPNARHLARTSPHCLNLNACS